MKRLLKFFVTYKPKSQLEAEKHIIKHETTCEYKEKLQELTKARKLKAIFDENYKKALHEVEKIEINKSHILFEA